MVDQTAIGLGVMNVSENRLLEQAQSLLENLFRKMQQAENPAPDNRKFSSNFLALHLIKAQFALNKFKSCERFFRIFDLNQKEGILMS